MLAQKELSKSEREEIKQKQQENDVEIVKVTEKDGKTSVSKTHLPMLASSKCGDDMWWY